MSNWIKEACDNAAPSARTHPPRFAAPERAHPKCRRKLFIDDLHRGGETSGMPEQELPINTDISLEPPVVLPLEISAVGDTRLISLISNHSAESDVWLGEQANGKRVAVKIYRHGRIPG